ncbi:MAG: ice-binding family protein [Acidimicrobiales bacterium]
MRTTVRQARQGSNQRWFVVVMGAGIAAALLIDAAVAGVPVAAAAQPPVALGTTASFALLAGSTITNTGSSVVNGNLGLYPGTSVTGFPPGVVHGTEYVADSTAQQAQSDLTTAYNDAAGRTPATTVTSDLGGQTLAPGVYKSASSMALTGTVTLDGQGNPNAVFVFQAGSTLTTGSGSTVQLTGGAQACNVFWQVGSSTTLGTSTVFAGTILSLTSATLDTGATVVGRVMARNGAVTLDTNTITVPTCTTTTTTTTATTVPTTTATTVPTTTATTVPTTTATTVPVVVPSAHTGEPWAGWLYWLLTALAGAFGLALLGDLVHRRRVSRRTGG